MTNYYSVVQLVPDPVTDERINIAVIVFSGTDPIRIAFTNQWPRVKSFWGHDTSSLHSITAELLNSGLTFEKALEHSFDLTSSIQITNPRNSEREADELLRWLVERMLVQRTPAHRSLTKSGVAAETRRSFKFAISQRIKAKKSPLRVETGFEILGAKRPHVTDVSLHNGRAIVATRALSFLGTSHTLLAKDVELCYWAMEDIRSSNKAIELAVIVAPPDGGPMAGEYVEATKIYAQQQVPVIAVDDVYSWADSVVGKIAETH